MNLILQKDSDDQSRTRPLSPQSPSPEEGLKAVRSPSRRSNEFHRCFSEETQFLPQGEENTNDSVPTLVDDQNNTSCDDYENETQAPNDEFSCW
jgi:hypothetical protein